MVQNPFRLLAFIFLLSITVVVFSPFIGGYRIQLNILFLEGDTAEREIFLNIRLLRVVFAFLVGGALAMVGAVFQALLRNDLATPYTLGVSSGGAFGAVLAIKSGIVVNIFFIPLTSIISILFSLISITIIYFIARGRHGIAIYTLILAGVAISFFFSAMILFVHYLADFTETYRMVRWLMGALDITSWKYPVILLIFDTVLMFYFLINANGFNLLLAGDEMARSKGLNVKILQKRTFFFGSALIGVIVSIAGPIGFIGLIIPHVMRLTIGPNHRYLLPGSFLSGGAFLVLCDTFARTVIYPAELPVGIITSIFGGPFFIYLLIRRKRIS
jgi:iron complex transport system permease protein